MFRALVWTLIPILLFACTPFERPSTVVDCASTPSREQLQKESWLQQEGIWQLRQSALLEIRTKKIPLEGVLRLDTAQHEARLVAMNEMGLVLFDLELNEQEQQLHRSVPQLQQQPGFAVGVAESLRRIFLAPTPRLSDQLQDSLRLLRDLPGGRLEFIFGCSGELQETRQQNDAANWRVLYRDYRPVAGQLIPHEIIFNDYDHGVKLSLWVREVKRNDE